MSEYITDHLHLGGNDITVLYPEKEEQISDLALTGVLAPSLDSAYPYKVTVVKTSTQRVYRITLQEQDLDGKTYHSLEFYYRLTKKGAMRKANSLIRRSINMGGVL